MEILQTGLECRPSFIDDEQVTFHVADVKWVMFDIYIQYLNMDPRFFGSKYCKFSFVSQFQKRCRNKENTKYRTEFVLKASQPCQYIEHS